MHTLPNLPYDYSALEPFIDTETMKLHHSKHHQTYVDKLNAALENYPELQAQDLKDILSHPDTLPDSIRQAVINHGGGHFNHSFFWPLLSPTPTTPSTKITQTLESNFGSLDAFKQQFTDISLAHFGSGWTWLAQDPRTNNLSLFSLPNQDTPLSRGLTPLLNLDLWEHAYYLKYQNRRAEYIEAFWHLINWPQVELNLINN